MITQQSEHFTFPLDETYLAFGDGSVTTGGVFYGLVLIPEGASKQAEDTIVELKLKYGGTPSTPIHCRQLFASDCTR